MGKSALVYIVLTLVTVGFGFCVRNSAYTAGYLSGRRMSGAPVGYDRQQARNLVAETAVFCLLAGVSACRIAVGGDYWVYWLKFQLIDQGRHVSYEKGFVGLVKLFHWIFGEGSYLPIFGFFSLVTVFFFLKALHDQADWYVVSLFLLLTQGFYFNSMNSVRYYFALALAMYAQKYVLRGEYGKFILWVLLGCTIHKSVLLIIPAYIAADLLSRVRLKKWHYAVGLLLILSLIFGQGFYRNLIFKFYPYYKDSMFDNGQLSYVNIGKCLAVLILCLIYCYLSSSISDTILKGGKSAMKFEVVTRQPEELSRQLMQQLRHGVTVLQAEGMYSHTPRSMLICVVNRHQVVRFQEILARFPDTFACVSSVNETWGNFKHVA